MVHAPAMSRIPTLVAALMAASLLGGCVYGRCCPQTAEAAPPPAPEEAPMTERPSAWYRGENGASTDLATMVAEWKDADLVAFGELHGNLVGAEAQLAMLTALHSQGRPRAQARRRAR